MNLLKKLALFSIFLTLFGVQKSYCDDELDQLRYAISYYQGRIGVIMERINDSSMSDYNKKPFINIGNIINERLNEIKDKIGSMSLEEVKKKIKYLNTSEKQAIDNFMRLVNRTIKENVGYKSVI